MYKVVCLYHCVDFDGYGSGVLVKREFPDAFMIGMNYGYTTPWSHLSDCEHLIIVDYSLPIEVMRDITDRGIKITWIDHHKTAIDMWEESDLVDHPNITAVLDTKHAAIELTWKHFHPGEFLPLWVHLLGRYDVWDFEDNKDVMAFQYRMRAEDNVHPYDRNLNDPENIWNRLERKSNNPINQLITEGHVILNYVEQLAKKTASTASFELMWEGVRFLAMNILDANSSVLDSMFNPEKHDAVLLFGWRAKYAGWNIGMYTSKPHIDLSPIAKKYGGGGHAGACGFSCKELPFPLLGWNSK